MTSAPKFALRVDRAAGGAFWPIDFDNHGWATTTEDAARAWAVGLQRALGADYACMLLRDGAQVDLKTKPRCSADLFGGVA
jgi:hypothetical protein